MAPELLSQDAENFHALNKYFPQKLGSSALPKIETYNIHAFTEDVFGKLYRKF